jgi:hypothetical protein
MPETPTATCPFSAAVRGLDEPDPARSALGAAGPIVRATAPAGGPVWIVTDERLARAVLADPRISKDTALAPRAWDPRAAGLEPAAAEQPALLKARHTLGCGRPTPRCSARGGWPRAMTG